MGDWAATMKEITAAKQNSQIPPKCLTAVVDLKLPPLFPSHSQVSEILPVLMQTYLNSVHLSGLDFLDEVRFGSGKVADLFTTLSESILSISLFERGTESWVLPVGQARYRNIGELDRRQINRCFRCPFCLTDYPRNVNYLLSSEYE